MAKRKPPKTARPKASRSLDDQMEDIFREIDRKYPPGRKGAKARPVAKAKRTPAINGALAAARVMANPRASAKKVAAAKRCEVLLTEGDPEMREVMLEALHDFEQRESTARQKKKPASRSAKPK